MRIFILVLTLLSFMPMVATGAQAAERKILYWYDPMVPGQKFDKPGKSPFMDMDLVPFYEEEEGSVKTTPDNAIHVDATYRQALGVKTAPVKKHEFGKIIHAVGTITPSTWALRVYSPWNRNNPVAMAVQATSPVSSASGTGRTSWMPPSHERLWCSTDSVRKSPLIAQRRTAPGRAGCDSPGPVRQSRASAAHMAQFIGIQLARGCRSRAARIALCIDAGRCRVLTGRRDVLGQWPHLKLLKRWMHNMCTSKFQQRAPAAVTVNSYSLPDGRLVVSRPACPSQRMSFSRSAFSTA